MFTYVNSGIMKEDNRKNVRVCEMTYRLLEEMKVHPNQSFDEVIRKALDKLRSYERRYSDDPVARIQ